MREIIAAAVIAMVPFSAMAQTVTSFTLVYAYDYARHPYQQIDHNHRVYGQSDPAKQQAEITKRRKAFYGMPERLQRSVAWGTPLMSERYQNSVALGAPRMSETRDCARNPSYMYFTSPNAAMIANRLHADFGCE